MSLHRNERRKTATIYVLVPVAAVLAASTALAAASGRLPAVLHTIGETLGVTAPAPETHAPEPVAARRRALPPASLPTAPPEAEPTGDEPLPPVTASAAEPPALTVAAAEPGALAQPGAIAQHG